MKRSLRIFVSLPWIVLAGCQPAPEEDRMSEPPPPPAALIAPVRESMSIEEKLARLQGELDAALARDKLDVQAYAHVYRAEAITDRLLESEPAVAWLSIAYGVESWLRQLQALADRVVAQIRRDEPEANIRRDNERLRESVATLRNHLAESDGRRPPPSLDSLLASFTIDSMPTGIDRESIGQP